MAAKIIDALLPSLLAFGPVFLMMGIPMNPAYYSSFAGAMMLSFAGCLLSSQVSKLERRILVLENKAG